MNMESFVVAFDEFLKDMFDIDEAEQVVTYQEGAIYSSLFVVNFADDPETNEKICFISFNDAVPTSVIVRGALNIVPYIEDGLEMECFVDMCHFNKTSKSGKVTEVVYEDDYKKTIVSPSKKKE